MSEQLNSPQDLRHRWALVRLGQRNVQGTEKPDPDRIARERLAKREEFTQQDWLAYLFLEPTSKQYTLLATCHAELANFQREQFETFRANFLDLDVANKKQFYETLEQELAGNVLLQERLHRFRPLLGLPPLETMSDSPTQRGLISAFVSCSVDGMMERKRATELIFSQCQIHSSAWVGQQCEDLRKRFPDLAATVECFMERLIDQAPLSKRQKAKRKSFGWKHFFAVAGGRSDSLIRIPKFPKTSGEAVFLFVLILFIAIPVFLRQFATNSAKTPSSSYTIPSDVVPRYRPRDPSNPFGSNVSEEEVRRALGKLMSNGSK